MTPPPALARITRDPRRGRLLLGAVSGLLPLAVYVATLAPSLTGEDSGELAGAAAILGVAHPPGFPLWTLLAHLWTWLPVGDAVWRVNFFSACAAAATCFALYALVLECAAPAADVAPAGDAPVVGDTPAHAAHDASPAAPPDTTAATLAYPLAACAAALALAFSPTFWSQALIAEIYALNALALVVMAYLLVRWGNATRDPDGARWLRLASLAGGLGLSVHLIFGLAAFGVLAFLALHVRTLFRPAVPPRRPPWLDALACAALFCAGLALYLYLPLRASTHPAINWGNPETLEAFRYHVTRAQYRNMEAEAGFSLASRAAFFRNWAAQLSDQLAWPMLVLAAVGAARLWSRARPVFTLSALVWLFTGPALVLLVRHEVSDANFARTIPWYVPCWVVTAWWAGVGLGPVLAAVGRSARPAFQLAAAVAALSPVAWVAARELPAQDMSGYRYARSYATAVLSLLPRDAVVFPSGDYISFPLAYLQAVEGARPDVIVADTTGRPDPRAVRLAFLEAGKPAPPDDAVVDGDTVLGLFVSARKRPVYVTAKVEARGRPAGSRVVPEGLVYRVLPPARPGEPPTPTTTAALALPRIEGLDAAERGELPRDRMARSILIDWYTVLGEHHFERGERAAAARAYGRASAVGWDTEVVHNNLGVSYAEHGETGRAIDELTRAVALRGTYKLARRNLAQTLYEARRFDEARAAYREALEQDPFNGDVERRMRDAEAAARRERERAEDRAALERFTRELEEAPSARVWNDIGTARSRLGLYEEAEVAYRKAIALDPRYALAQKNLALLYEDALGDPVRAKLHWERYAELGGKVPERVARGADGRSAGDEAAAPARGLDGLLGDPGAGGAGARSPLGAPVPGLGDDGLPGGAPSPFGGGLRNVADPFGTGRRVPFGGPAPFGGGAGGGDPFGFGRSGAPGGLPFPGGYGRGGAVGPGGVGAPPWTGGPAAIPGTRPGSLPGGPPGVGAPGVGPRVPGGGAVPGGAPVYGGPGGRP